MATLAYALAMFWLAVAAVYSGWRIIFPTNGDSE